MKKTTLVTSYKDADRAWKIVDASTVILGDLSVLIANALRGKDKPDFTPQTDTGAHVIVLNADKVPLTGNKEENKLYYRHSGYTGNLKTEKLKDVRIKNPKRILEDAVSGMLPKNKLRKQMLTRLYLFTDENHPFAGQKPTQLITKN